MLTKAGAKLLDFGLAKLRPSGPVGVSAPTMSAGLTGEGAILGTLQYMAPEQLEGKEADHRTDIFAFGAVVYEMATGQRAFTGDSQASLIGAILKDDPGPMSALQPMSPLMLDRIVKKCLAKDPDARWQTVHDMRDELTWIAESDGQVGAVSPASATRGYVSRLTAASWVLAGVVATALAVVAVFWGLTPPAPPAGPVARFTVPVSPANRFERVLVSGGSQVAISRDGTLLAYVAEGDEGAQLYIRELAADEARLVRGATTNAATPFFSPNGEWVGFFDDLLLKKVSVGGGTPITLAAAPASRGGTWNEDGVIVFASPSRAPLSQVSDGGGTPELVTVLDTEWGETSHRQPQFLPGGDAVVFLAEGTGRKSRVVVQSLETGERHVLVDDATRPRYSLSGHLLYEQSGATMAAPFDLERLELTGPGAPILPDEATLLGVSDTGTLTYLATDISRPVRRLVWVTRAGREEPIAVPPDSYMHPRLSPNGRRVAVDINGESDRNIWLHDTGEEGVRKLTTVGDNLWPVWAPDGAHITYASNSANTGWDVHWTRADGAGTDEVLVATEAVETPRSWSPDGQTLAFLRGSPTRQDIWLFALDGAATRPWRETVAAEFGPVISPNGQWIAYVSLESGSLEVYVRPVSGSWQRQVSTAGGVEPVWSRDGRELFYWNQDQLHVVNVSSGDTFEPQTPVVLFEEAYYRTSTGHASYDLAPDGRFLMVKPEKQVFVSEINIVTNWFDELQRLVPSR